MLLLCADSAPLDTLMSWFIILPVQHHGAPLLLQTWPKPQAAHRQYQMQPEHFEMWLGCFNRSMVAHILPPDVADKLHHCFQSLTSAMQIQIASMTRLTSPEARSELQ